MKSSGGYVVKVLEIRDLEKQLGESSVFPSFQLEISTGKIISVYANTNIRTTLLNILLGKTAVANGEIHIVGKDLFKNTKKSLLNISVVFREEGLYERLTVKEHIKFFKKLYDSSEGITEILRLVQLDTMLHRKVKSLSYSEKKRIHFARLLIQKGPLCIFEEPDQNVDLETKRILINLLGELKKRNLAVLILTGNMESAITLAEIVYRLDENGIRQMNIQEKDDTANHVISGQEDRNPETIEEKSDAEEQKIVTDLEENVNLIQINKIPTKVNDKIVLFDPLEIDYIESADGGANIHIKGEVFISMFTLNELEERLRPFGFFRCHRSYIVNLQKVNEVITWTRNSFSLILDDTGKSSVPLSKSKMANLKEMLGLK